MFGKASSKFISVSNLEAQWKRLIHAAYRIEYGLYSIILGQQQCRYISTGIARQLLILTESRQSARLHNKYPVSYSLVSSSRLVDHILHTLCKLLPEFIVYSNIHGIKHSNHSISWHLNVPGHRQARHSLSGTLKLHWVLIISNPFFLLTHHYGNYWWYSVRCRGIKGYRYDQCIERGARNRNIIDLVQLSSLEIQAVNRHQC